MADPIARTRAMLHAEIELLRAELPSLSDPEEAAEVAVELDRAQRQLAYLNLCFVGAGQLKPSRVRAITPSARAADALHA